MVGRPLFDRIKESTSTTGTGTITLAGALTGFRAFSTLADGSICAVLIEAVSALGAPTGQWEICQSTYTLSGTTLSRGTLFSSSTGSRVSFSAGTKRVSLVAPAAVLQPWSWNFVTDFGAVADGSTDNSAIMTSALQTIIDTGGGDLFSPSGVYVFSGALQDTGMGGANAVVPFPQIDGAISSTTAQLSLTIRGALPGPTSGESTLVPAGQTIFKVTSNTGSGTLPSFLASKDGTRNNIRVTIDKIVFQMEPNPQLTCLNLQNQQNVTCTGLLIHTGSMFIAGVTEPTHPTYAIIFPRVNNCTQNTADELMVWGYFTAYKSGEFLIGGKMTAEACKCALEVSKAFHANYIVMLGAFECQYAIVVDSTNTTGSAPGSWSMKMGLLDIENANGTSAPWQDTIVNVYDPTNLMTGSADYHVVDAGFGVNNVLTKTGGTGFTGSAD